MKLLLDTHVLLWALEGRLAAAVLDRLYDEEATAYFSAAGLWEVAIKLGLGKIAAPHDLPELLPIVSVQVLPVLTAHVWAVRSLPPLHRDPFDRLMVVQAMLEDLTLVTHDGLLARYGCRTMVV